MENAWGLDATSLGNHEFDFGVERLLAHIERANFPFLATNVVEEDTGETPDWLETSAVFNVNGIRVGVIGSVVRTTPELVRADATAGLEFLDEAERIEDESARLRRQGVRVQIVVIHEGAQLGNNRVAATPASPWQGPIIGIVNQLQNTTVDLVVAGHTHRAANTVVGRIPVVEGFNGGISYSVAQLMVSGSDVVWAGTANRTAKNLGVAPRPDVKAIVDEATAAVADDLAVVIGEQEGDILRAAPNRDAESAMGNLVADAMRLKYVDRGAEAAITNSGGLRADLLVTPPSTSGEAARRDHLGRGVRGAAVRQRDGGRDAHRSPAHPGADQRVQRRLQPDDQHRPLPAGVRPRDPLPLRRHPVGGGRDLEGPGRAHRDAHAGRPDRHRPLRHQ